MKFEEMLKVELSEEELTQVSGGFSDTNDGYREDDTELPDVVITNDEYIKHEYRKK